MKILGRIVYALVAGLALLWALNIAENIITAKYFEKHGPEAAQNKDDEFFYSGAGFHKKEPMLSFDSDGYQIKIYEINKLFIHNRTKEKRVEEYLYILVYDDNNIINPSEKEEYYLSFYNENEDLYYDVALRRFRELDVFVAVYLDSNEMSALLKKEAFLNHDLITISILHENESTIEILFEESFTIKEENFVIGEILLNHYDNRGDFGIYDKTEHSTTEFQYINYLVIGIYMGLLIITTYFVFFFKFKKFRKKAKK